jgi:uncharacterized membrane protein
MATQPSAKDLFELAKDAGNKLRAYMLSYSSGATAVFFLALTGRDLALFNPLEKTLLVIALVLYVATAFLCLLELRTDARRFFHMATQIEQGGGFAENQHYKNRRLALIYASYVTAAFATGAMVAFLISRIS